MNKYDPDKSPTPADWLDLDEQKRILLVEAFHRRQKTPLPNAKLHGLIHVVVENQIALKEEAVVATLARLQREGLTRHDALHAIGSVLVEYIYELMRPEGAETNDTYKRYRERLPRLTAKGWRAG